MVESFDTVAIITAGISAGISILSIYLAKKNDVTLEKLKSKLEIEKDEQAARRDYEFEARKRLYLECEPILFQLAELSESALLRIYALAKNAKQGNLGPERYYLSHDHYFIRSTIYRLLAPMSAFKLLQRKLTSIDLKLNSNINIQYQLSKILYYTFSSGKELAESDPTIPYDPDQIGQESKNMNALEKKEQRSKSPEKYWLQDLKVGTIDNLVNTLIETGNDVNAHIKSFGEFEATFFENESWQKLFEKQSELDNNSPFEIFFTLFSAEKGFHPKTRPVLWRILITQAYLYQALKNIHRDGSLKLTDFEKFKEIAKMDHRKFEWRQPYEEISDQEFNKPFRAVENYLHDKLIEIFEISSEVKQDTRTKEKRHRRIK